MGKAFTKYAVLGDYIVIADTCVAEEYRKLLDKLGVSISLPKSLISDNGTLEFAKRYRTKALQKDLSPVSIQALLTVRSTLGIAQLANQYRVTNPAALFRLAGAGYRVRARLYSSNRSRKWDRLWVAATKPLGTSSLPLEWWIGRGLPLNPYLKGLIVEMLRKELQPQDIRLVSGDLVFNGELEILERTLILNWVKQWLKWNYWYFSVALGPDPSIYALFTAPICAIHWKRTQFDADMVKYGLIWRCYDMGAGRWSTAWCPPYVLDPNTKIHFDRWIFGGYSGLDFMMAPVDIPVCRRLDD